MRVCMYVCAFYFAKRCWKKKISNDNGSVNSDICPVLFELVFLLVAVVVAAWQNEKLFVIANEKGVWMTRKEDAVDEFVISRLAHTRQAKHTNICVNST